MGGYIEIKVFYGCEKIGVGKELTIPSKVDVSSTVIGFPSSSTIYYAKFTVVVTP